MFKLSAKIRDISGKAVKTLRQAGEIPAVIYGAKDSAKSIILSIIDFRKVYKEAGESSVISLELDGKKHDALIHDVQFDPISGEPIHVDFLLISQDKELEVDVPLVFEGVAPVVKELGANLVKVMHELPISALPKNLPHDIVIDVSVLKTLDDQILVSDIKLPAGVKPTVSLEEVVVSVTEAGEEVVEEEIAVDLSAIEVEKKGKTEEESASAE